MTRAVATCGLCPFPRHRLSDEAESEAVEVMWWHMQNAHRRPEYEGVASAELSRDDTDTPGEYVYRLPARPEEDLIYLTHNS